MRILSFCGSWLQPDFRRAQDNLWLHPDDQWIPQPDHILEQWRLENLCIDPLGIQQLFTGNDDTIILMNELINESRTKGIRWSEGPIVALSTRQVQKHPLPLIQIGLLIEAWRWRNLPGGDGCGEKCLLNTADPSTTGLCNNCDERDCRPYLFCRPFLCENCGELLWRRGEGEAAVRIQTMAHLFMQANINERAAKSNLGLKLPEAMQKLQIKFNKTILREAATNVLQDYFFAEGGSKATELTTYITRINEKEDAIKEGYKSDPDRQHFPNAAFLIACRRWNSWTPNLPRRRRQTRTRILSPFSFRPKTGGGYLISDGSATLVVDPGYGFLDLLFRHGITVMDLDAVLITHDHPDHAAELQNILDLRFVYRDKCRSPLEVYLNPSSFLLYKTLVRYRFEFMKENHPKKVDPGSPIVINRLLVETIGMNHEEMFHKLKAKKPELAAEILRNEEVVDSAALGLKISGSCPDGAPFRIVIPGDTSFPRVGAYDEIEKLSHFFRGDDDGGPQIACLHLGSLEKSLADRRGLRPSQLEYGAGKHLGLIGLTKLLNLIEPMVAVITEFGEELDVLDLRLGVKTNIETVNLNHETKVVPADIDLVLALRGEGVYFKCSNCHPDQDGDRLKKYFVPIQRLITEKPKGEDNLKYIFPDGCGRRSEHLTF